METIRIAILGAAGRMGQILSRQFADDARFKLVARVDSIIKDDGMSPPITRNLTDAPDFDVLVDFSAPQATCAAIDSMRIRRAAWIVATTGLTEDVRSQVESLASGAPIFVASNTSVGVAVMQRLCKIAAAALADWDTEIVEAHHRNKVDAPSGTALSLAKIVADVYKENGRETSIVTDRTTRREPRPDNVIGISSIRGGTVAGMHSVTWYGQNEQFQVSHTAESREIFANGARRIALWLASKAPGIYDMQNLMDDILG